MRMATGEGGAFEVTHRMVLGLALPMTIGFLTTPLLGITDTAVAGRLGDPAFLAGLAIGSVLFDLVFQSLNFLRASTTALTAQAWGRGDATEQEAIFFRALALALGLGLVLAMLSPLILRLGLVLMAPDPAAASAMADWFSIRMLAGPATLGNYVILGFLLGRGQSRSGLALQALINGINIALSILLGLTWGFGIEGIAWATVSGEAIGLLAGLAYVLASFRNRNPLAMSGLFRRDRMSALLTLNGDIMIRSFALLLAFAVLTRIGASFGPVTLAANAVLMNFFMIAGFWLDGLANAAETIVGRSIGANYRPAFDRGVRLTLVWSFVLAFITSLGIWGLGPFGIAGLSTDPEVQAEAMAYLLPAGLTALTGALAFLMDGVFIGATWSRAMRNWMLASLVTYLAALAILVPLFGNAGLWAALNIFLLSRGLYLAAAMPKLARQSFAATQ